MSVTRFLIPDATFSQDLSVGSGTALDFTTSFGRAFRLGKITFKVSAKVTEKITITLDSGKGASYDVILREKTLVGQKDYVFVPDESESDFQKGDEVRVQMTAANDTGTVSGIVKTSELLF